MSTTDQPIPLATAGVRRALDKAAQSDDADERTYAEAWANSINETYPDDPYEMDVLADEWLGDHEIGNGRIMPGVYPPHTHDEVRKFLLLTLAKAAVCLRSAVPATLNIPNWT